MGNAMQNVQRAQAISEIHREVVRKPERNRPFGRSRCLRGYNIKTNKGI